MVARDAYSVTILNIIHHHSVVRCFLYANHCAIQSQAHSLICPIKRTIVESAYSDIFEALCIRRHGRDQLMYQKSCHRRIAIRKVERRLVRRCNRCDKLFRQFAEPAHSLYAGTTQVERLHNAHSQTCGPIYQLGNRIENGDSLCS